MLKSKKKNQRKKINPGFPDRRYFGAQEYGKEQMKLWKERQQKETFKKFLWQARGKTLNSA